MTRIGKKFEFGYPYISDTGLYYCLPNENYEKLFDSKRKELSPVLLEKAREYVKTFKVRTFTPLYPYLEEGKIIVIHLGSDGRWVEIGNYFGWEIGTSHNLDSSIDRFVAFNLVSDTLEVLDPEIKPPRILLENENIILNYPLPQNYDLLPTKKYPNILVKEFLQKRFSKELGDITNIIDKEYQEIRSKKGKIHIESGICQGLNFKGFDAVGVTFLIAILLNTCQ